MHAIPHWPLDSPLVLHITPINTLHAESRIKPSRNFKPLAKAFMERYVDPSAPPRRA